MMMADMAFLMHQGVLPGVAFEIAWEEHAVEE